ncbi:MAG: 50S ribosomal protein L25 [Candidatus Limnocylindrales bacterium]|nr:50S ribosomal protein L25 [Chloroflexota bacterium]
MTTARPTLAATHRDVIGKKVARLRRAGRLPAVLYGHGVASASVSIDAHEFELLRRHVGATTLIDVSIDGRKAHPALVQGVQVDPVRQRPLHVDLFLVRMTEELTVDVRVTVVGESEAVTKLGGTLSHLDHLRVRALPDHLPDHIELPIAALGDFDAAIHVRDLTIPADVTLVTDPDEVAARVLPPRLEEEVAPVAETAAEGAPAEPEGDAAEGATTD